MLKIVRIIEFLFNKTRRSAGVFPSLGGAVGFREPGTNEEQDQDKRHEPEHSKCDHRGAPSLV